MKKTVLALSAVAALSTAALADVTINLPGGNYGGGQDFSVTSPALYGTLTGIVFHFDYSNAAGASWASDMAAVVGPSQWGGYNRYSNGATMYEADTGAPGNGDPIHFTSEVLPVGTPVVFNGSTTLVGWGNGYTGGSGTMEDVTITLVGVELTPTPGAAALLGLGGLAVGRRRRA
ncbi:MAG: hypothetical protein K2Q09_06760 [Phycisphaerales bacterium]|nr:hypothetical protein [Phycisphaerales bacterium]